MLLAEVTTHASKDRQRDLVPRLPLDSKSKMFSNAAWAGLDWRWCIGRQSANLPVLGTLDLFMSHRPWPRPPTHVASKVSAADRRDRAVCTLFRTPISFKPSDFIRRLPFLKKLRRNLHNVKLTILNVRFSGIWCTRVLCNHQLHLVPKRFCHPKKRACPLSTHRPTPPPDPGTHCPTLSPWTCGPWTGHLSGITTAWPLVSGFSR